MANAGARAIAFDLYDAIPALRALRDRARLALLTNNPSGAEVLNRHGLHTDVFHYVVIADPSARKPDPRAFQPLLDQLDLAVGEIAYIGDSISADVEGALGVGMRSVWIDRWNDPLPLPPNVVRITSLLELIDHC